MAAPDYLADNVAWWDADGATRFAASAPAQWSQEPQWGIFGVPEAEVGLLPADLDGRRVLEDGCGTAYVSAWVARRGALPVGIDPSPAQLATARRMQEEHDLRFPLILGIGEALPFPDASFDVVLSEYGAALWADPYAWIPEAARVLRPGGELSFLSAHPLVLMCVPPAFSDDPRATPTLLRPLFGLHRISWEDTGETEFTLPPGRMLRLLRDAGLEVLDLVELEPPEGATTTYDWVDLEWARRWPVEWAWRARKRGG